MNHRVLEKGLYTLIKFCMKLGTNAHGACIVLPEAYGREALRTPNVFVWHILFKEDGEDVDDDKSSRLPRSNITNENI
jgi:hypothetical protein